MHEPRTKQWDAAGRRGVSRTRQEGADLTSRSDGTRTGGDQDVGIISAESTSPLPFVGPGEGIDNAKQNHSHFDLVGRVLAHHVLDGQAAARVVAHPRVELQHQVLEDDDDATVRDHALDQPRRQDPVARHDGAARQSSRAGDPGVVAAEAAASGGAARRMGDGDGDGVCPREIGDAEGIATKPEEAFVSFLTTAHRQGMAREGGEMRPGRGKGGRRKNDGIGPVIWNEVARGPRGRPLITTAQPGRNKRAASGQERISAKSARATGGEGGRARQGRRGTSQ